MKTKSWILRDSTLSKKSLTDVNNIIKEDRLIDKTSDELEKF